MPSPHMIGYASQSSFTRWFAAEFGIGPAAWRAAERQERPPRQAELFERV
jgi:AraC-like DNA-binding protein